MDGNFPGSPLVKTPLFQYRGCRFDPWSGNWGPTCCVVQPEKKKITGPIQRQQQNQTDLKMNKGLE